jgi:hypothetical protein
MFVSFCLIAVVLSWATSIVVNGQNKKLAKTVTEQQQDVFDLMVKAESQKALIKKLKQDAEQQAVRDVVLALDYILPQVCTNELRRMAYKVKKLKEEEKSWQILKKN